MNLENFKRWFIGSKIVNPDNTPKIVYHGTDKDIKEFKNVGGKIVTIFGEEPTKRTGFFFASSKEAAKGFGNKILEVYLSIKNPFDLIDGDIDSMLDNVESKGINRRWVETVENWELFDGDDGEDFIKVLKELNYDGVIFKEPNVDNRGGISYIAFYPNQIKSINNNGEFSKVSDNIYESFKSFYWN